MFAPVVPFAPFAPVAPVAPFAPLRTSCPACAASHRFAPHLISFLYLELPCQSTVPSTLSTSLCIAVVAVSSCSGHRPLTVRYVYISQGYISYVCQKM